MSRFRPALNPRPASVMPPSAPPAVQAAAPAVAATPSTATPSAVTPSAASPRPAVSFGILGTLLGLYLFMHTLPFAELLDTYLQIRLYEVVMIGALVTLGALFTGRIDRFLRVPMAKPWIALGALFMLASAFGIYRRQSGLFTATYLIRFHAMPFLICAAATTLSHVRKLILWPAAAWIGIVALCAGLGEYAEGRFHVPGTILENPNDLSFLLLFSSAYGLLLFFSRSKIARGTWLVALPATLFFVLQTGSRANFLTFLVALAAAVVILPGRAKIAISTIALVSAVVLAYFIPASTWSRLTTISSDPEEELMMNPELSHELGSQIARTELQRRAYQLALTHPLLGVGPLMFAEAADKMVREETGLKTSWQNAHNVYLQIGAENGIPAMILYIACFWMCWQMNYRSFRMSFAAQKLASARAQSFCLALATIILAFGIVFCNFVYDALWPILVGLSAANYLAMLEESRVASAAPRQPQPAFSPALK